jgi:hypothetical protein
MSFALTKPKLVALRRDILGTLSQLDTSSHRKTKAVSGKEDFQEILRSTSTDIGNIKRRIKKVVKDGLGEEKEIFAGIISKFSDLMKGLDQLEKANSELSVASLGGRSDSHEAVVSLQQEAGKIKKFIRWGEEIEADIQLLVQRLRKTRSRVRKEA